MTMIGMDAKRRMVRLALGRPGVISTRAGRGKGGTVEAHVTLDADAFRRALWAASFGAFLDYQRQLGRDSLRLTVERTERRLFGYIGAHRGED